MDNAMISILSEEDIRDLFEEAGFEKGSPATIILAEETYRSKEIRDKQQKLNSIL